MLYVIITLIMGLFVPVQTAANARLRSAVGPAYVSTFISFSVSSLLLLVVSLLADVPLIPTKEQIAIAPWWSWFGGIIALLTITCVIYLFKELGQLQATVIPMFSQLLFSMLIDNFGWLNANVIPFNSKRVIGSLLLCVGVTFVAVLPRLRTLIQNNSNSKKLQTTLWQLAAVVSGCLMAAISAVYAHLGSILASPIQASTVSFLISTTAIFLFCAVNGKVRLVGKAFSKEYPWWMWLGGVCGATTVFGNAWLIPKIGVGLFSMSLLVGQLTLSLLMERFGWLGAEKKPISWMQISGIVLMLLGVGLIRF